MSSEMLQPRQHLDLCAGMAWTRTSELATASLDGLFLSVLDEKLLAHSIPMPLRLLERFTKLHRFGNPSFW
jgi:hypothetical protein